MRTRTADTERLLEFVGEAYSFDSLEEFRPGLLEVLNRAIPSDWISYNEVGANPRETTILVLPSLTAAQLETFSRLANENPILAEIRRTGDGRPRRFSDLVDRRTLHSLSLYREFYRPLGVETQAAFTLPARPPLVLGIAMCRGPEDYSEEEIGFLSRARPHLIQAYRNAELSSARVRALDTLEQGLDTLGQHLVLLDAQARIELITPTAALMLEEHGAANGALPPAVRSWLAARAGDRSRSSPLVLPSSAGSLLVRVLPRRGGDDRDVLVLEGGAGALSVTALRGLGLTPRQAETLRSTALGRSPAETARSFGVARRTVDKHLQAIYSKLGVSSKAQASAVAWAAVGTEPAAPTPSAAP